MIIPSAATEHQLQHPLALFTFPEDLKDHTPTTSCPPLILCSIVQFLWIAAAQPQPITTGDKVGCWKTSYILFVTSDPILSVAPSVVIDHPLPASSFPSLQYQQALSMNTTGEKTTKTGKK